MKKMTIRLPEQAFEQLRNRAFQARLPLSSFIRFVLCGEEPSEVPDKIPGSAELLSIFHRILSNLTQLQERMSTDFYSNIYTKFQIQGLKIKMGECSQDQIESISLKIQYVSERLNYFARLSNSKIYFSQIEFFDALDLLNEFIF